MSARSTTRSTRRPGIRSAFRARLVALAALACALTIAVTFFSPGTSAQARINPIPSNALPVVAANTDILIESVGDGLTITGLQPPTVATPDPTAPYPVSDPAGYESISTFAGTINTRSISDDSLTAQMYCINLRVETETGIGYESGTWEESNVPNIGYVSYILNAYHPSTTLPAGLTVDQRASAVQAAIWYFTDGFVVPTARTDIRSAVAAIVADAQTNGPVTEPAPPDVTITPPTAATPVGTAAGPFVVAAEDSATVTVSVPAGSTMYSDAAATVPLANPSDVASGSSIWVTNSAGTASETVLSARAVVTVPRGEVYLYDGNNPSFEDAQRLILAATAELDATAQATATFFAVGSLTVNKSFTGAAAGLQGPSQLLIDCGSGYVFTADIPAEASDAQTFEFANIPVDSSCVVSEPVTGTNTVASVTSDAPVSVTIAATGASASITNTVTFQPGGLNVTKVITGDAAGQQGEIVLEVDCGEALTDAIVIPANQVAGEVARSYTDLPADTECTVTETVTGASGVIAVEPGPPVTVTIAPGVTVEASLTNTVTLQPGGLNVTKVITGNAAGQQGEIVLDIDCGEALTDSFVIPASQAAGEYSRSYTELPAGTECTVTESSTGATDDVEVAAGIAVTVAIAPGAVVETVITNTVTGSNGGGTSDDGTSAGDWLPTTGAGPTVPLLLAGGGIVAGLLMTIASALISRRRVHKDPAGY